MEIVADMTTLSNIQEKEKKLLGDAKKNIQQEDEGVNLRKK